LQHKSDPPGGLKPARQGNTRYAVHNGTTTTATTSSCTNHAHLSDPTCPADPALLSAHTSHYSARNASHTARRTHHPTEAKLWSVIPIHSPGITITQQSMTDTPTTEQCIGSNRANDTCLHEQMKILCPTFFSCASPCDTPRGGQLASCQQACSCSHSQRRRPATPPACPPGHPTKYMVNMLHARSATPPSSGPQGSHDCQPRPSLFQACPDTAPPAPASPPARPTSTSTAQRRRASPPPRRQAMTAVTQRPHARPADTIQSSWAASHSSTGRTTTQHAQRGCSS
jgi:hypothetical protein